MATSVTLPPVAGARAWRTPVAVAVVYLGLAQGLSLLTSGNFQGPVFWPAAGVGLGVLLISERRRWPAILAAILVAELVSNLIYQVDLRAGIGWSLANVLHPLVAATLLRRFRPDVGLRSPVELAAFVTFGGIVGPAVSAAVGTTSSVLWWNGEWSGFLGWWVGDGLGALVIAPLFLVWRVRGVHRSWPEVVLGSMLLVATTLLVFRNWGSGIDTVLPYLVIPPLVWAALRFGVRGASFGVATVGMLGGWSTSLGYGPFAASGLSAVVLFEIYLAVLLVTAQIIAVLVSGLTEREEIERAAERRRRQQVALVELGQHVLVAERADEVLAKLDGALRVIAAPHAEVFTAADPGSIPPADPGSIPPADPWSPLARHPGTVRAADLARRYPVQGDALPLVASAATLTANALDRLEQESRLRERARELEDLNAQLERAIAFREQLISMVSHELRSPLTPILGFADILRRSLTMEGDLAVAVEAIERNARRILALIDELLLAARAAEGTITATPTRIDVVATVRATLDQLELDVPVELDAPAAVGCLMDPGHLGQCVINLVTNAVKYGAPPIVVRIRAEEPDGVRIEVCDHGPGVPASLQPVLFERFTRAEEHVPDPARGVGLGLSIVQTLVEANGGTVTYQPPASGRPTRFVLRFPRSGPAQTD